MEDNNTMVPTGATPREQRPEIRKQKKKRRSGNREMRMWRHRNITAHYHELPKTRQTRGNLGCTTGECKTYNTTFHAKDGKGSHVPYEQASTHGTA